LNAIDITVLLCLNYECFFHWCFLQVFHSLLKAHAVEARGVVRQALEILTPSMPGRMEDGNNMLTHWTKKIIIEDGHTGSQLVHILQLVVKHFKVYYPVRHHLIQHVVTSVQRLGFTATATIEQKRLAVDLCEVVIKWETQRAKEEHSSDDPTSSTIVTPVPIGIKRPSTDQTMLPDPKRSKPTTVIGIVGAAKQQQPHGGSDASRPIDKQHCDTIVNYLLRLACAVNDSQAGTGTSPGEMLSRR
jgi:transformation/transcription domain-associated protein